MPVVWEGFSFCLSKKLIETCSPLPHLFLVSDVPQLPYLRFKCCCGCQQFTLASQLKQYVNKKVVVSFNGLRNSKVCSIIRR